jgi:hypothetical protein
VLGVSLAVGVPAARWRVAPVVVGIAEHGVPDALPDTAVFARVVVVAAVCLRS